MFLPHLLDLSLVGPRLFIQGLLQHRHLLLPLRPELLLSGRAVQRVFQLCLQGLQLLAQVSLLLFSLVPGGPLRVQVLLEV